MMVICSRIFVNHSFCLFLKWASVYISASLCNWDLFKDAEHLSGLLKCLNGQQWRAICERLIKNHRHTRSGFPDLTLWNPKLGICSFVEVKGPNDRLSAKQILWIEYLNNHGISSLVCHVEAVNARKIVASSKSPKMNTSPHKSSPIKKPLSDDSERPTSNKEKSPPKRRRAKVAEKSNCGNGSDTDKVNKKRKKIISENGTRTSKRSRCSSDDDFKV